jgi:hypothetical protein
VGYFASRHTAEALGETGMTRRSLSEQVQVNCGANLGGLVGKRNSGMDRGIAT